MFNEAVSCGKCGAESHPDAGSAFFTCYKCDAQLVCRSVVGRGWEVLTPAEVERLRILDLEWHVERDKYKIWDRMGWFIPNAVGGLFWIIVGLAFGSWLLAQAIGTQPGPERDRWLLYGAASIFGVGGYGLYGLMKAKDYTTAYSSYQERRLAAVLHPAADSTPPNTAIRSDKRT
jgi:hypothetical protein